MGGPFTTAALFYGWEKMRYPGSDFGSNYGQIGKGWFFHMQAFRPSHTYVAVLFQGRAR